MKLKLHPKIGTPELLDELEVKGVIRRIYPNRDILDVKMGESKHVSIYESQSKYGPHKLIAVTINQMQPTTLTYHSDDEDFMLLGASKTPMVLIVSLDYHDVLEEKIRLKKLSEDDFISIVVPFNDPYMSFFTMRAGYAHVETCLYESMDPPSFYVGECRDLDENRIDFKDYEICVEGI